MRVDMNTGNELGCPICAKQFDNRKSHARHIIYCRKKSKQPPRTRKRSCLECTQAKARCDALSSPCSRCLARNIACRYELHGQVDVFNQRPEQTNAVVAINGLCESVGSTSCNSRAEPLLSTRVESLDDDALGKESGIIVRRQDMLLDSMTVRFPDTRRLHDSIAVPTIESTQATWFETSPIIDVWKSGVEDPISQRLIPRATKSFWSKGLKWRQLSLVRKLVLSTLRTYPRMMLSDTSMPHFIHPLCMNEEKRLGQNNPLGPLPRCAGIVSLWQTKNRNNKQYLWKIIRLEQERLFAESGENSDWDAVAALQAITIYFLLRVSAEDDDDTDFDVPLIQTMMKLARRVDGLKEKYWDPDPSLQPAWEAWLLVESLQRTIWTLFIIEFLFDISIGRNKGDCGGVRDWSLLTLPSSSQLWTARTRSGWEQEYRALSNDKRPTFGDLLKHDSIDSGREVLLDRWMEQVDEFGALVVNAASLAKVITSS